MSHTGAHKTEKVIKAELDGLMKRARPDFRGHIPAPAPAKTRETVTAARKAEAAKFAGTAAFKANAHRTDKRGVPLGFVASRCAKHAAGAVDEDAGKSVRAPAATPSADDAATTRRTRNAYNQVLDPRTQKPVISSLLAWEYGAKRRVAGQPDGAENAAPDADPDRPRPKVRIFSKKYETSDDQQGDFFDAHNVRAVRQDLEALTPRHRTALVRQIAMANPKFTAETRVNRRQDHWDPMTQLISHAHMPDHEDHHAGRPTRSASRDRAGTTKNGVRIVAAFRAQRSMSASGRPKPWH